MNPVISFILTLLEGARPEIAPLLEDIKADIASGKPITVADVKKIIDDAFGAAEADIPKFKNALEQTKLLLDQSEVTIAAWQADITASKNP
jgi:hypothetical protein